MRHGPYAGALALLQALALAGCDGAEPPPAGRAPETAGPAAATPPAPGPAPAPVSGPERLVLAFGDSLYAGYRLAPGESLPDAVQSRLRAGGIDARVVNAGVSGDTTAAGRQRLLFALDNLPRRPDLVLLGLGGNDMLRQIPVAETEANLRWMLDELARRDIPVVLTGMMAPPNLGPDYAGPFNALYPALARDYGATLDPFILDGVIGRRDLMLPDGIHPAAPGVRLIADRVAPLVADRLRRIDTPAG